MSLGRAWALALLAVPVVLLWLRLRAARPRAAEASSLLIWRKVSPGDTAPARPRPPLAAWIEALGVALLVMGAADPVGSGVPREGVVAVIRDNSPSMRTRVPGEPFVPGEPLDRLAVACRELASGGVSAGGPFERDPVPVALAESSAHPVVVITDHRLPGLPDIPDRVRVIGIGAPCFNAGITAASGVPLPNGRWRVLLTVEAYGASGPVEGRLRIGVQEETITVAPGRALEVVRDVAAGFEAARIGFKGDALAEDDRIACKAAGGLPVRCSSNDLDSEPLLKALAAAGARVPPLRGGAGSPPPFQLAVGSEEREVWFVFASEPPGPMVKGAGVSAADHVLTNGVHIDPASTLGLRTGNPVPATPLLVDQDGPLVTFHDSGAARRVLYFGFRPGGTWVERDPSFVVFAKNVVDYVAGGPARIEATGVLSSTETREAAEGETFGDLRQALEEARQPDPATRISFAFVLLLAGAASLVAAWLAGR